MELTKLLQKSNLIKKVSEDIQNGFSLSLSNLEVGEKALLVHSLNKKSIIVCKDIPEQNELKNQLVSLGHSVATLSYCYIKPIFSYKQDYSSVCEFISVLFDFYLGKYDVLIVLSETLLQKLPDKSFFDKFFTLEINKTYTYISLQQKLVSLGYSRCDMVSKKGDFAIRGDIVDIFLIDGTKIRLDFFGDSLEKISEFDLETMKTFNTLSKIDIYPASFYVDYDKGQIKQIFEENLAKTEKNIDNFEKLQEIKSYYEQIFSNDFIESYDSFVLPLFDFKKNILNIFDNVFIFIDEPKKVFDNYNAILNSNKTSIQDMIAVGELLQIHNNFYTSFDDIKNIKNYCLFDSFSSNVLNFDKKMSFRTIGTRKYTFDYNSLVNDLKIYTNSSYTIVLFCGSVSSQKAIGDYLISKGLAYKTDYDENINGAQIVLTEDELCYSASFLDAGIIFIGTNDLVKKTNSTLKTESKSHNTFYLPKIGDLVVHNFHGIGKCIAVEKLNFNGISKDYFILEYKGGDKLYVPSEQANTISAYLGSDKAPKLNKIGGDEFAKIKERVKNSVKELAINLVELYKKRSELVGYKYSNDNYLMDKFEEAFKYELTTDQQNAISDIKNDLYSNKIMDRLICGDVGYGKTEVALRAAYQVVLEGKQVAFLCPTTILSEQHFNTTKERTKDFGCNVEVLNRFKTKQQQDQILTKLKNGEIDIIIGTHRLLSQDVVFKDLGLLILDEEHRFGVGDKEKIKDMKKDIDVLTLSATPIPRTLNMAMTGIRDISLIETPPKNRLPVQTFVAEESESLIQDACKRELSRDGQVLIVYNDISKIYDFAERIRQLVPSAVVGVAHGQMPEKILEDTIYNLYKGEYNIFVSTTLIENGIDLPLANTLIVINSDKLGLSQLYQLRGRIGRSDRLAYAYFTYNPSKVLTVDAYKRLDAILEFTELGSGFKIAMRDLEIRGAGNILGKEQHGHMEKVGYELYCKILSEAVNELSGKKEKEKLPIKVDLGCPAYLDNDYISSEDERIKLYSKISELQDINSMQQLKEQTEEVFGKMNENLFNLFKVALIKNLAQNLGASKVISSYNSTKIYLYKKEEIISKTCANVLSNYKDKAVLKFEDVPIIEIDNTNMTVETKLSFLIKFLTECTND